MLSAFDCSCGSTSPTVRSTSTPLIMRKHLREVGRGVRVSRTSLCEGVSKVGLAIILSRVACCIAERERPKKYSEYAVWRKGRWWRSIAAKIERETDLGSTTTSFVLILLGAQNKTGVFSLPS